MVQTTTTLGKLFTVTLFLNRPSPHDHSKIIPVAEVLLPLAVRKIVLIYWIAFGAIGAILNAVVTNRTHDNQRKNNVAHLRKPIEFFLD
ncbi:MAG: hypothetical protein WCP92_05485 [bacterium]